MEKISEVKDEINEDANKKYNLEKYNKIIDGSDDDVLTQYETWYDQLAEVVINNNNAIKEIQNVIKQFNEIVEAEKKEEKNNDEVMLTLNSLVDKIINKETIIFNKKEDEFKNDLEERQKKYVVEREILNRKEDELLKKFNIDNEKLKENDELLKELVIEFNTEKDKLRKESDELLFTFNTDNKKLKNGNDERRKEFIEKQNDINNLKYNYNTREVQKQQHIEKIKFKNDFELSQLNASIELLLDWSGKQNYKIIFDSYVDGNGEGVVEKRVIHKRYLYFIHFDNQNNVFGGYVNNQIYVTGGFTKDSNAFVFSLIRNGRITNIKYNIMRGHEQCAFWLNTNYKYLYGFGRNNDDYDICVPKIGYGSDYKCTPVDYENYGEQQPLRNYARNYRMRRIIILEMK
ncbi:TLDc domain-containing protein [Entamoeba marina]